MNAALLTFLLYTLAVFGLAAMSNQLLKRKQFLGEYFLGSRSLGVWALALTFAATSASGGSFTGFPSKIYTHGWVLGLWIGSYTVVPICAMGLLGKRINHVARLSGAITVPDVLRDRFRSPAFGLIAVTLIVFFMAFNLVGQFKAGSEILNTLLTGVAPFDWAVASFARIQSDITWLQNVDPAYFLCLLMFAVAVIVYTTYGGFHAVVWTDVMQGIVMVVGVLIMLPLAIIAVGGLGNATEKMSRMTTPRVGLAEIRVDVPPSRDFALAAPWFTLPGDGESRPRLFRVNKTFALPKNQTVVEHVRFVEITTPEEIDAQLERLRRRSDARDQVGGLNAGIRAFKQSQISWLEQNRDSSNSDGVDARISRLQAEIQQIEQNDVALLNAPELNAFRVEVTLNREYRYGSGLHGQYVTGPGPEPPALPDRPGTVDLRVHPPGTDVSIATAAGVLRVRERIDGEQRALALEAGRYRVSAKKVGFQKHTAEIDVPAAGRVALDISLSPSDGDDEEDAAATDALPAPVHSDGFLPLSLAISFFFMWAISGAGQPSSMVRLMAFNNSTTLRRSIFTVAIYYSMIYFPLVIIFCCARLLLPGMDLESDRIMPQMAVTLTEGINQPWLAGLLMAAPFAAVMSTVDSFLLVISSALVRDIYQRNIRPRAEEKTIKRLSYLCTLAVGTAALVGAVNPPQFLQDIIVYTGSGLAACFLGPMVFALYWPRANVSGCIAGMLAGFLAHLAMYVGGIFANNSFFRPYRIANFDPIVVGLFVSFVAVYLVTLITPPPSQELVRKYFHKTSR